MDRKGIVQIVNVIALTAIENLNHLICAGYLRTATPSLYGMEGIGKGLDTAVVCNGNCTVTPSRRLLNGSIGVCQGIHHTHTGMQVQLHPLFAHCGICPLGHLSGNDGKGLKYDLICKVVHLQLTLHLNHRAFLYAL